MVIEGAVLILACIYLLVNIDDSKSQLSTSTISLLAAYAFAGQKLLPSLQQVYSSLGKIKTYSESVNIFLSDLELKEGTLHEVITFEARNQLDKDPPTTTLATDHALDKLSVRFENINFRRFEKDHIIKDFSTELKSGDVFVVCGKSGSGKSTLIDVLMGLERASSGRLIIKQSPNKSLDNRTLNTKGIYSSAWRGFFAHVPQRTFLFDSTVGCNITLSFQRPSLLDPHLEKTWKLAGLDQFLSYPSDLELDLADPRVDFSGGQKQRIALARALYKDRPILVLDEATNGLDSKGEEELLTRIIEEYKHKILILITHNPRNFDYATVLHDMS